MKTILRTALLASILVAPQISDAAVINVHRDHLEWDVTITVEQDPNQDIFTVSPDSTSSSYSGKFQTGVHVLELSSANHFIGDDGPASWDTFFTSGVGVEGDPSMYIGAAFAGEDGGGSVGSYFGSAFHGVASQSFYWDFSVDGSDGELWMGAFNMSQFGFASIGLLDLSTGQFVTSGNLAVGEDWGTSLQLQDGHRYLLAGALEAEDFGNGDPASDYSFGFINASISHVPDAGATAGLFASAVVVLGFLRRRRA